MSGGEGGVELVVPAGVDDPAEPSGGNTYDRRLAAALVGRGRTVRVRRTREDDLAEVLAAVEPGAVVVLDGLLASHRADVVVPHRDRLTLVLLLHLPRAVRPGGLAPDPSEAAVVDACAAVVVTSQWCRRQVLTAYRVPAERVHVAAPGVDPVALPSVPGAPGELILVATVTRAKGHDVLVEAGRRLRDLPWRVRCVGSLTRDPGFVADLRRRSESAGVAERILLEGPRTAAALDAAYAGAGLLVLPSRGETYGMVVTEGLAHGLPVVASDVGGVGESLGATATGRLPGLLVRPDDPDALAGALHGWLTDADLRAGLRAAAAERRTQLRTWSATGEDVGLALDVARAVPVERVVA